MTVHKDKLLDFVLNGISKTRILVVGDVMLDRYYYGEVSRISPEAPVPINHVLRIEDTMGGSANVAHNLALLGCKTYIAGFVGNDYHCQTLMDKFTSRGIDYKGIIHRDAPTTTKLRVIGGHQQMLRLDFEDTEPVGEQYAQRLIDYVEHMLQQGLDALQDAGKQKVLGALDQHGDGRLGLQFQMPGVGIGLKALLLHQLRYNHYYLLVLVFVQFDLIYFSYSFKSSSLYTLNTILSRDSELLVKNLSTVFMAILQANSLGNLNSPVEMHGNAIIFILFFIAISKQFW